MTRYVIALSELGIKNNNLISLLLEHSLEIEDRDSIVQAIQA